MSTLKPHVLIILPAFNEGTVIGEVITDIQKEGYPNICVVDDGSSDNTSEIAKLRGVDVLIHPINRGAGAAVQTGIAFARKKNYQYVLLMDSDGQHLPKDIEILMRKMVETNADLVVGNRFFLSENDIPKNRLFYNRVANIFTNLFCKNKYEDTQSGFRLLNRKSIEKLNLKSNGFGFCSEMLIVSEKLDLKIEQTPIHVLYTDYSMNKGQSFRVGVQTARSIMWNYFFE